MNRVELQTKLKFMLAGGRATHADMSAVDFFLDAALSEMEVSQEPLSLITADAENYEPARQIDRVWFIRKSNRPTTDDEEIDLEPKLLDALANYVAYLMAGTESTAPVFFQAYHVKMDQYNNYKHRYLDDSGYFEGRELTYYKPSAGRRDLAPLLDQAGFLRFYTTKKNTSSTDPVVYLWDKTFVGRLDKFMLKPETLNFSVSENTMWDLLCAYEDDLSTPEDVEVFSKLDEYFKNLLTFEGDNNED